MRIAHVSDLHIRNSKFRSEYRVAFENLYRQLEELRPDLVVNTGDTVHSKLAVSPELFDDVANHMRRVSDVAPYWLILGNHDLNLKNPDRMDAISPIVKALRGSTVNQVRLLSAGASSGLPAGSADFRFWSYDIRGHGPFVVDPAYVNVGLYHGSISGCVTDMGFTMDEGEAEVSRFADMDYVLMGDIHKRQSFRDGRMRYPGSLIQQNYGEELEKGFLVWDIYDRERFAVSFRPISAPGRFYTVQVPADLGLDGIDVPEGSRIKARLEGELTPSRRIELERALTERFRPLEIITPDPSGDRRALAEIDLDALVLPREDMMREYLTERGHGDLADAVIALWETLVKDVEQDVTRGTTWSLRRMSWDNMMNYGEGNRIDLTKVRGIVGIFAPNASGKSSIFDIILQTIFDRLSKEVPRNVDLINDNRDEGSMEALFEAGGAEYRIVRTIERINYGQRKLAETKQWGKTSLDLTRGEETLNGTSRPETERAIRHVVGSFEDFALTTMVSQNPIFGLPGGGDIINCKETDRRKILFRFLDLDVYERVNQACREELKGIIGSLKDRDPAALRAKIDGLTAQVSTLELSLNESRHGLSEAERSLASVRGELVIAGASDVEKLELEEAALGARVIRLRSEWSRAGERAGLAREALQKHEESRRKLIEDRPTRPPVTLEDLTEKMTELGRRRNEADREMALKDDELRRGREALRVLSEVPCEGKFPTCRFISDAVAFGTRRDEVQSALNELAREQLGRTAEYSDLEQHEVRHRDVTRWEREHAEVSLGIERRTNDLRVADGTVSRLLTELTEAQTTLEKLRSQVDAVGTEAIADLKRRELDAEVIAKGLRAKIDEKLRQLGALGSQVSSLELEHQNVVDISQRVSAYEHLEEMTGKSGLPYRILTRVLPAVNAEISKLLTGITKFSVFFEDDPEAQSVSLFIRYGDYRSRPLSLGSGAEKFIASIAVRVALLNVSSLPKTDVLIIDEGFGKLDPEHLEALQKMFEYLREAFGTVFIVSHVDSMRDVVDHSVEITSRDGYAHVEVG